MLRRTNSLIGRARERIRAAAEHDPHAMTDLLPEGTVLVLEDGTRAVVDHIEEPPDRTDGDTPARTPDHTPGHGTANLTGQRPDDATDDAGAEPTTPASDTARGSSAARPGSPATGAPDLDVAGGVSGPPARIGKTPEPGRRDRSTGSLLGSDTPGNPEHPERVVPNGLRVAAAWSWRTIVVLGALYLALQAATYVAVVVVPVFVAMLLAALLQPGAAFLRRHGWPTSLAAFTMLVVGLGVVAGIITLVVEEFAAGYDDLADQVSQGLDKVQTFVISTFPVSESQINDAVKSIQDAIVDPSNRENLTSVAGTTVATVGEVLTGMLLTLFTLFFFLLDGRQIWLWLVGLAPINSQAYIDEAARRSWRTLISYVRATVAVAAFDAVFIGIGLLLLGTPLVVPLAALVFLGAFIPIIGSFLAGSVAVLVTLVAVGPVQALIGLGVIVLIMQLEGHVLQPLLLGRAVSVHPLAVVLGIAAGLLVGGIFGALVAVPVIACGNVAGTYLSRRHEGPRPPQPDTRRARRLVRTG